MYILLNLISTTMLLMVFWTTINFFQLDKKFNIFNSVQQMLNSFFQPILKAIKSKLPSSMANSQIDYSPLIFIVILWSMYRILIIV